MGTLQRRFRCPVVKPPGAKLSQFIAMLVEYPTNRSVFDMVPLVLQPPTKVYVFTDHHIIPKTTHLQEELLSNQKIAGGGVKKMIVLSRTLGPGTHIQRRLDLLITVQPLFIII